MTDKLKEFEAIFSDPSTVKELITFVDNRQKSLDDKGVTSKESEGLLDKIKALFVENDVEPEVEIVPAAATAKDIVDAVTAGVTAAMVAVNAQATKTDLEVDTEKAQKEAVVNLATRIEKLEGDVSDANTELKAAQKELVELTGEPGHRASKSDETIIVETEKALGPNADGLTDYQDQMMNAS